MSFTFEHPVEGISCQELNVANKQLDNYQKQTIELPSTIVNTRTR